MSQNKIHVWEIQFEALEDEGMGPVKEAKGKILVTTFDTDVNQIALYLREKLAVDDITISKAKYLGESSALGELAEAIETGTLLS